MIIGIIVGSILDSIIKDKIIYKFQFIWKITLSLIMKRNGYVSVYR